MFVGVFFLGGGGGAGVGEREGGGGLEHTEPAKTETEILKIMC